MSLRMMVLYHVTFDFPPLKYKFASIAHEIQSCQRSRKRYNSEAIKRRELQGQVHTLSQLSLWLRIL
jgi:hypothetical protein